MSPFVIYYSKWFKVVTWRLFSQISSSTSQQDWLLQFQVFSCFPLLFFFHSAGLISPLLKLKEKKERERKIKISTAARWDYRIASYPENHYCSQRASTPHIYGIWEHSITQGAQHHHHHWGGTPRNHTALLAEASVGFIQQLSHLLVLALLVPALDDPCMSQPRKYLGKACICSNWNSC